MICIYHKNCSDGFAAALSVWLCCSNETPIEFIPAHYGDAPPNVANQDVIVADFSYPREVLEEMHKSAASLVVLDHHKTAEAELSDLDFARFDPEKSGAVMTWEYLFPEEPIPKFFLYIQDRDLWRKELPGVDEFTMGLRSYPMAFDVWADLMPDVEKLINEGAAIVRYNQQSIEKLLAADDRGEVDIVAFEGYEVPILNATKLISEIGEALGARYPFVLMYFDTADKRVFSLRSNGEVDVGEIARRHGGGGHRGAAGFTVEKPDYGLNNAH